MDWGESEMGEIKIFFAEQKEGVKNVKCNLCGFLILCFCSELTETSFGII